MLVVVIIGTMPVKLTVIVDNPTDPSAFEAQYAAPENKALLAKIPNIQRVEAAKVFPKEDGSPTPAYRTIDIYFADYATACAALESPEAGELAGGLVSAATGGIRFLLSDIED
ncbi:MAG TPA: EthD family reductase [Acidimicrobiales bacterium]|nr:EthD family reductase [Acidimicrobiales bacterium]